MTRFLTVEDVCDRYQVTKRVVHGKTSTDRMPYLKRPGWRRLMFNPAHLDLWDNGAYLEVIDLEDGGKLVKPKGAEA